jgi:hypothetical protein
LFYPSLNTDAFDSLSEKFFGLFVNNEPDPQLLLEAQTVIQGSCNGSRGLERVIWSAALIGFRDALFFQIERAQTEEFITQARQGVVEPLAESYVQTLEKAMEATHESLPALMAEVEQAFKLGPPALERYLFRAGRESAQALLDLQVILDDTIGRSYPDPVRHQLPGKLQSSVVLQRLRLSLEANLLKNELLDDAQATNQLLQELLGDTPE